MRIVKLSPKDKDMKDIDSVHKYFSKKLHERNKDKFYSYNNIRKNGGLYPGEWLVFSYKAKIVYIAVAQTAIKEDEKGRYFKVNMDTLAECNGDHLDTLRQKLNKKLGGRGWNIVEIDDEEARKILRDFKE